MGQLDKTREPFSVRAKQFWDLGQARAVSVAIENKYTGTNKYNNNNIIKPRIFLTVCLFNFF